MGPNAPARTQLGRRFTGAHDALPRYVEHDPGQFTARRRCAGKEDATGFVEEIERRYVDRMVRLLGLR